MKKLPLTFLLSLACLVSCKANSSIRTEKIIQDLKKPVYMTAPSGSNDFLYFLEKEGRIMVYDRNEKKLLSEPFLDIRDKITIRMNEQGLLGMAFSPSYSSDGLFYLYYTDNEGDTQVSRFHTLTKNGVIKEEKLISVKQDFKNHNGGWIGFGPDGNLYIALGDGGAGNDPKNRAQDMKSHLGKLLRIDVSSKKGYTIPNDNPYVSDSNVLDEIYAFGLRNPWRCSWDEATNRFYIADVGQNAWEEVNVVTQNQLKGGDFGWRMREATHKTVSKKAGGKKPKDAIDPVFEYPRSEGRSITGGYVYQGKIPTLKGHYFFADFVTNKIWSFQYDGEKTTNEKRWESILVDDGKPIRSISSFGVDPQGELYLVSHSGKVFKIVQ